MANERMEKVEGYRLRLRLVRPDDAPYIYALRSDPHYNAHLSSVEGGVEEQVSWIKQYKRREAEGNEYYFIIERVDDLSPCGVVRLYNIVDGQFTWGSWILDDNKPFKAALESAVLIYRAGFRELGCSLSVFDVRLENEHTISFHRRFGAEELGRDDVNSYFQFSRAQFDAVEAKHNAILKRGTVQRG